MVKSSPRFNTKSRRPGDGTKRSVASTKRGAQIPPRPLLRFFVVIPLTRGASDPTNTKEFLLSVSARSGHSSLGRTSISPGRNAMDRGRGRALPRSSHDFPSNFGPQTHNSTRRNPHFIRLTPSTVPNTAVGPLVLRSEGVMGRAIDYEAAC